MVKCGECGKEFKTTQGLAAHRSVHRQGSERSEHSGPSEGQLGEKSARPGGRDGKPLYAPSPLTALLLELANQRYLLPNTPPILYGWMCAKKLGFEGDINQFLQEVIDDFYARRGINYYQEVMGWEGIGEAIRRLPEART